MTQPTAFGGRKLPANDWEGDDHTPGAHGGFVTCGDTSGGRAVAWATDGRIVKDGSVYRAVTKDPDGITLAQLSVEISAVAHMGLWMPHGWIWQDASAALLAGTGLIVQGYYDALPPAWREQTGPAHFAHDMFMCYRSIASGVRLYDPLRRRKGYGRWIPAAAARAFIESGGYTIGYLSNQPLVAA